MDSKTIVNNVYHTGTTSGIMLGNSWVMIFFFFFFSKIKSVNLDKIDVEDAMKLTANISIAILIKNWLIHQGLLPENIITDLPLTPLGPSTPIKIDKKLIGIVIKDMATGLAMIVGGAVVNALAFTRSNYLFSTMSEDQERKRHDLALEKLQKDRDSWNQARLERIDYINEQLKKQGHAERNFEDVDSAMRQYYDLTGIKLDDLPPEPHLYDRSKSGELLYVDDSHEESIKNGELALLITFYVRYNKKKIKNKKNIDRYNAVEVFFLIFIFYFFFVLTYKIDEHCTRVPNYKSDISSDHWVPESPFNSLPFCSIPLHSEVFGINSPSV